MPRAGRKNSPEHNRKISEALKGREFSEEHRRAISLARTGSYMGQENPNWRGGRMACRSDGYVYRYAPDHPNPSQGRHVLEHRWVMEQAIGRYLRPEEVVHHINNDPSDNRIENLSLFPNHSEHVKYEAAVRRERKSQR